MRYRKAALILLLVVLVATAAAAGYRCVQLRSLEGRIENRWSRAEGELYNRVELTGELLVLVEEYAAHEEDIIDEAQAARQHFLDVEGYREQIRANRRLDIAVANLKVISESYPDLQADQDYVELRQQLARLENRIAVERIRYNESVQVWNNALRSFPTVVMANLLGWRLKPYLQIPPRSQEVPTPQM